VQEPNTTIILIGHSGSVQMTIWRYNYGSICAGTQPSLKWIATTKHLFYTEIWALKCFVIFVEDSVKKPLLIYGDAKTNSYDSKIRNKISITIFLFLKDNRSTIYR
jgi:hypothetical protein